MPAIRATPVAAGRSWCDAMANRVVRLSATSEARTIGGCRQRSLRRVMGFFWDAFRGEPARGG